ncbi:hypothetical protein LTR91_007669 [Friedmanniomyces endolithicus]|uniref:FAD dependent oxidoreductase domain-containing protein n=1 Tax=Friedmanniomyces endolithicus TaxID=329885 RepID=A0AAN6J1C6_9PEZI|nr:hypothetical protein LTR82_016209 [Friedmanniomyces endolithicus]KAK0824682.1 hypothetical protein LTR73_007487 [Friedmanniomyces endolithicus]KAK0913684.1 hypothetical protein LTR57_014336 [Friedmanniomyces endolithicus]KAK0993125.1 hypothetical protein LTS01_007500 [Friedmanniomyces endolithicus]KAK0994296.1 hypothetical protein LTR91_007669 [Friedmanniomyces endolithicus]
MEERARIPPGLPRPRPTVSYWQDPPADIADLRTTAALPANADYVVVGSGISGAFVAYKILCKQPEASVVVLEARQAASGATGRNGGHTKAASYRSFVDHEKELGLDEAMRIARLDQTHLDAGKDAIRRMRGAMGEDDPAAQYRVFNAAEARKTFRTPSALGAFQYAAGSLSAYAFAIGVLKLALGTGLNLQTTTPAESIASTDKSGKTIWTVQTPRGCIKTPNLVLATNGYTAHLVPQMQGLIVPLHGQVVAQRPGLSMPQTGLPDTYSFIHETGYEYMITRPPLTPDEGTIVIGGGLWQLPNSGASRYGETDDTVLEPTITKYLRDSTPDFFGSNWGPDHASGRIRKEWSGIMGASADGLPYVGAMPDMPGLWISAAFNGHGMVWCLKAAEALVEMVMGDEGEQTAVDEWLPRSARMSRERMGRRFMGRKDLRAPGEGAFGERGRL